MRSTGWPSSGPRSSVRAGETVAIDAVTKQGVAGQEAVRSTYSWRREEAKLLAMYDAVDREVLAR